MNKTIKFDEPAKFSLVLGGTLLRRLHPKSNFDRKWVLLDFERANRKYGR